MFHVPIQRDKKCYMLHWSLLWQLREIFIKKRFNEMKTIDDLPEWERSAQRLKLRLKLF